MENMELKLAIATLAGCLKTIDIGYAVGAVPCKGVREMLIRDMNKVLELAGMESRLEVEK